MKHSRKKRTYFLVTLRQKVVEVLALLRGNFSASAKKRKKFLCYVLNFSYLCSQRTTGNEKESNSNRHHHAAV